MILKIPILTKGQTMNKYQSFALSIMLSEFPDDMTYESIIDHFLIGDYFMFDIVPWALIEHLPSDQIGELIESIANHAKNHFKD